MTVWVLGAYTRDLFMRCDALPRDGESIALHEIRESDGGKGTNQAVAAARLGAAVVFVGALGDDEAGDRALTLLAEEGIRSDGVQRVSSPTGTSFIMTAADDAQTVSTFDGASTLLSADHVAAALNDIVGQDFLSLQGEIPIDLNRAAIKAAKRRSADVKVVCNPSPIGPYLDAIEPWDTIDVLIVNEIEANDIASAVGGPSDEQLPLAELVREITSVPTVIMSMGGNGAIISSENRYLHLPAPRVGVVDTTGAGDAFAGALIAELDAGSDIQRACEIAVQVGAASVTKPFCIPSYPHRSELVDID